MRNIIQHVIHQIALACEQFCGIRHAYALAAPSAATDRRVREKLHLTSSDQPPAHTREFQAELRSSFPVDVVRRLRHALRTKGNRGHTRAERAQCATARWQRAVLGSTLGSELGARRPRYGERHSGAPTRGMVEVGGGRASAVVHATLRENPIRATIATNNFTT